MQSWICYCRLLQLELVAVEQQLLHVPLQEKILHWSCPLGFRHPPSHPPRARSEPKALQERQQSQALV